MSKNNTQDNNVQPVVKTMYLVSLIGVYKYDADDYTVRLFTNKKDANKCFQDMTKEIKLFYAEQGVSYSNNKTEDCCILETENGDNINIFLQAVQTDGSLNNIML